VLKPAFASDLVLMAQMVASYGKVPADQTPAVSS